AAYLLNSGRSGYPLDQLCADAGSPSVPGALETLLEGASVADTDPARIAAWTGARAEGVWRLAECQAPRLQDHGLERPHATLGVPLTPVPAGRGAGGDRGDPGPPGPARQGPRPQPRRPARDHPPAPRRAGHPKLAEAAGSRALREAEAPAGQADEDGLL